MKFNLCKNMVSFFKIFKWYELLCYLCALISVIVIAILVKSSLVTIIYSIFGIFYVALLAKQYKISLLFGIIQVSFYIIQSVLYKNWGEVILNSAFVLPCLFTSFIKEYFGKNKKEVKIIENKVKYREWLIIIFSAIIIYVVFYFILNELRTPFVLVASLSCMFTSIAHYLLIRNSIYMFYLFICVNLTTMVIWILSVVFGNSTANEIIPMIVTIFIYNVSNVLSIINWTKNYKKNNFYK